MIQIAIISLVILAITLMAKSRGFAILGFCVDLLLSYKTVSHFLTFFSDKSNSVLMLTNTFIVAFIVAFIPVICTILEIILYNKYKPARSVIIVRYLDPAGHEYFGKFYTEKDYNTFAQNVIPQGYRIISANWGEE